MAEFRAGVLHLVERPETRLFEFAVFGRVSSGKSSLLNQVLETNVLPVGVNPMTAVPTRIVFGPEPFLTVTLADRDIRRCPITDLPDYASEELNPGNGLGVTRLVVSLYSPRLEDGLVLVDTPGLGALARAGAAETLSYLPQCDLGIVLISAVNPIDEEGSEHDLRALSRPCPGSLLTEQSGSLAGHRSPEGRRLCAQAGFRQLGTEDRGLSGEHRRV